jgi:hypothetical protein
MIHYHEKKRKEKRLIDTSKEVGLEVNPEKTKYMLSCQNTGQTHSIKSE